MLTSIKFPFYTLLDKCSIKRDLQPDVPYPIIVATTAKVSNLRPEGEYRFHGRDIRMFAQKIVPLVDSTRNYNPTLFID